MTTIEFPLELGCEWKHAMSGESDPNERGLIPHSFTLALLDQLLFLDTYDIEEMSVTDNMLHLVTRYTGTATKQGTPRTLTWEMDRSEDRRYAAHLFKINPSDGDHFNGVGMTEDNGDEYGNQRFTFDRATLSTLLFADLYTIEEMSVKDGMLELQTRYAGPETPADMMRVFTWDTQIMGLEGVVMYGVVPVHRQ